MTDFNISTMTATELETLIQVATDALITLRQTEQEKADLCNMIKGGNVSFCNKDATWIGRQTKQTDLTGFYKGYHAIVTLDKGKTFKAQLRLNDGIFRGKRRTTAEHAARDADKAMRKFNKVHQKGFNFGA